MILGDIYVITVIIVKKRSKSELPKIVFGGIEFENCAFFRFTYRCEKSRGFE